MATTKSRLADRRRQAAQSKAAPKKAQKNGDDIWDELLATPESDAFLQKLSEQAHSDYQNGLTEEGGFDNSDAI